MLTIDLLKGQGIPLKSRPGGATLLAISIAMPIIVTIFGFGDYMRSNIVLSTRWRDVARLEGEIFELAEAMRMHEESEREAMQINSCLGELDNIMDQQLQWSPVLEVVARNIPDAIVLEELVVQSENVFRTVPLRRDTTKNITVPVPRRQLILNVYGKLGIVSDEAVLLFLRKLATSEVLKERMANVRKLSQKADERNEIMHYTIECTFKIN